MNQINDKKRAKVAVRKLTRKRPEEELETIPTQQPQQPFTSFTTQVTQKFGFGDSNTRYNTVNRPTTTLSPFGTSEVFKQKPQQPQQQPQQPSQQQFPQTQPTRVPFFKRTEQTTPAFFEASPGAGAASKNAEPKTDGNRETTPFSLLRNPIVAAGPNFNANQNRGSNNFQQNRQTTANYPQTTPNGNVQTQPPSGNFQNQQKPQQQARPIAAGNGNFQQQPQSRPIAPAGASSFPQQQNRANSPVGNTNFQQQPQQTVNNGNFPQNRQQINNGNFQQQSSRPQAPASNGNFQQQTRTQAPINNGNFQQPRQQASAGNGNFQQQGRQQPQALNGNFQQNRQSPPPPPPSAAAAAAAPGQNYQQINRQSNQRQSFNRNFDEFDEGDNQEFLKTAPSNNFRPSDINSFTNNYKTETKNNNTRFGETSTTKYITPTIITTPRPTSKATPAYDTPPASRQNFYSTQTTSQQSNFYSPTVSTTQRVQPPLTSTLPPTSRLPQRIYPSSTSAKPAEVKDVAYDYAYYDDSGSSFADYGSFDHLGEPDFSRTSQRAKSRLI